MAGESARERARLLSEKAARHKRATENYERGADGESATARALQPLLEEDWVVLHDVAWPGRPRANIDHVVIGPGGVFVIDSKNWSGTVAVRDDVLRQNGRRRESAVVGVAEAADAVSVALGGVPATAVLCFTRDEPIVGRVRDVMVCTTANVEDMVASRTPTLHAEAVSRFARRAALTLPPATEPRRSRASRGSEATGVLTPPAGTIRRPARRRAALVRALVLVVLGLALVFAGPRVASELGDRLTNVFTSGLGADVRNVGASPPTDSIWRL